MAETPVTGNEVIGSNRIRPSNWRASKFDFTVHPDTGQTISQGDIVYISGFDPADRVLKVSLADADAIGTAAGMLFISWNEFDATPDGQRSKEGILRVAPLTAYGPFDTSGATVGDRVYLSTTAGGFTLTAPAGTGDVVRAVGTVLNVDATDGWFMFNGFDSGDYSIVA